MNRFALNRATLNGVTYALVLASASFACSAAVSAAATRQADALAPASSAAYITAAAQVTRYVSAVFDGVGGLYPQVTHTQAASATLQGNADISAYVLRSVLAEATVYADCNLVAIAASTLGQAQSSGSAQLIADATRVQAARSDALGAGGVALSVAPTIIRLPTVSVQAGASLRAEPSIWQIAAPYTLHSAYVDMPSGAELVASALATRPGMATLGGVATVAAVANVQQPGGASAPCTAGFTAEAATWALTGSYIRFGTAEITAQATRTVVPAALTLDGTATFTGAALQNHSGSAPLAGSAAVLAQPTVTQHLQASLATTCDATATALRVLNTLADFTGDVAIVVQALRTVYAQGVTVSSSASLAALADQTIRVGEAGPQGQAELQAQALVLRMVQADVAGTAELTAQALRLLPAAASTGGTAEILADTITNAASVDPLERTFVSPLRSTAFVRSFIETEFKRAA